MTSPTTPASIGPGEFFPVVGVGPHDKPWPEGDQYDPELLLNGDRRNVLDHYPILERRSDRRRFEYQAS